MQHELISLMVSVSDCYPGGPCSSPTPVRTFFTRKYFYLRTKYLKIENGGDI